MTQHRQLNVAEQAHADVQLLQSLAATHAMFGRIERAIGFLHLALWVTPDEPETLRLLAMFYYRLGRFEKAEKSIHAFERTGKAMPDDLSHIRVRLTAESANES